jgi:hypothetical protein
MATRSWNGGSGDWYSTRLWNSSGGTNSYPFPGDTMFINSGTVDLLAGEEAAIGTVDGVQISLGSSSAAQPAAIVATEATLGHYETSTIPGSVQSTIELQWNAAWPSTDGGVSDELGMALHNTSGQLVALSNQVSSEPDYGDIPEIALSVPGSSTTTQYELAIYQIGPTPVLQFKYILFGSPASDGLDVTSAEGSTTEPQDPGGIIDDPDAGQGSGSVHGHQLVLGVNTVGAVYWSNAPAHGVAPDWTEYFSSGGLGTLLYSQNGTALATPEPAGKVDFVAPDGIQTSVPNFPGFSGTSAPTPNAAAVAALMLQDNPALTTSQVTARLEASAVSMGLPAAQQGAGLIQAPAAVDCAIAAAGASGTYAWTGASVHGPVRAAAMLVR